VAAFDSNILYNWIVKSSRPLSLYLPIPNVREVLYQVQGFPGDPNFYPVTLMMDHELPK
jgi:hypothetical protein